MADIRGRPKVEPAGDPSQRHCSLLAHSRGDFPFEQVAARPLSQCLLGLTRGTQLSKENPFSLLLRGILHEHRRLIVLLLIALDMHTAKGVRT